VVLCSAATRTRETLDLASLFWSVPPTIIIEPELYLANERVLMAHIRRIDQRHKVALVIGHNPGMQGLALDLAIGAPSGELDRLATKFPTGGLALFDLKGDWTSVAPGATSLRAYITPKMLERI
jgi:phosphohistidine phosphatase